MVPTSEDPAFQECLSTHVAYAGHMASWGVLVSLPLHFAGCHCGATFSETLPGLPDLPPVVLLAARRDWSLLVAVVLLLLQDSGCEGAQKARPTC